MLFFSILKWIKTDIGCQDAGPSMGGGAKQVLTVVVNHKPKKRDISQDSSGWAKAHEMSNNLYSVPDFRLLRQSFRLLTLKTIGASA